ncbi:MAG TPA: Fur family transcriptional regulator [Candidatus Saccharimonadales bacterium]|nr:Fur family transcriptional regulator [Candidatus Saccharimonadales bacterium]
MSSPHDAFRSILKKHRQSVTQARLAVFEALLGQEPVRMHELVERVGNIDRSSVYRAVELFEKLGIVQRLNTGWKYRVELTDIFTGHHHHLTCNDCGKTIALNEIHLESVIDQLSKQHGFEPTAHQIEIQGICQVCLTKRRAQASL